MNWFELEGKEMANLTLSKLKEKNGILTKYEVWDIIDSNTSYGFRKTMIYASQYLEEYGIKKTKDGGLALHLSEGVDG